MIQQKEAIEIARRRALEKGWAFSEPVYVIERSGWRQGITRFEIETNAGMRGTKARFTIDAKTGEIISEGYIPR
jgi:uncharacterized membrane protein YkoI